MEYTATPEQPKVKPLEQLLDKVHSDRLLVISSDSAELYNLVELGDYDTRGVKVGETEFFGRYPVRTPVLHKRYATSLDDITTEANPWYADAQPADEAYIDAARELAKLPVDSGETVTCGNCKGAAFFTNACSCTLGGVVFTDFESGTDTKLREDGAADPSCKECSGEGVRSNACPSCSGAGYNYKYPILTLTNKLTGESTSEVLNVADLISRGLLPMIDTGSSIITKISELEKHMAAQIGINPDRLIGHGPYGAYELVEPQAEIYTYAAHAPQRVRPTDEPRKLATPAEVVTAIQDEVTRRYTWNWESTADENGVVSGKNLFVQERADASTQLKELVSFVEARGFRLAYRRGFIATGEDAPTFSIVDDRGALLVDLATEYGLDTVILNAHTVATENLDNWTQQLTDN